MMRLYFMCGNPVSASPAYVPRPRSWVGEPPFEEPVEFGGVVRAVGRPAKADG